MRRGTRGDLHARAQTPDRIEHRADRIGERAAIHQRHRVADRAAATEEAGAIGLVFDLFLRAAHDNMGRPNGEIGRAVRPAHGQQSMDFGQIVGLDEKIGKGRMGRIGGHRREHHFRVGSQFDLARLRAGIGDREAAQFEIVVRGNENLEPGRQASLGADEACPVFRKNDFIALRFHARWLAACRPYATALGIAQEQIASPRVAGRVFAPARHGKSVAGAVTRAGAGEHDGIAAVRQQMGRRHGLACRVEAAGNRHDDLLGERADARIPADATAHERVDA